MLALNGCRVWRPAGVGGGVEFALAEPADRSFPARTTTSLGVCLKRGPEHDVRADGRLRRYPTDAICVRPSGCVWSCDSTGPAGFQSIDIEPTLLPEGLALGKMEFLPVTRLPELERTFAVLDAGGASAVERQEAIAELLLALHDVLRGDPVACRGEATSFRRARAMLDDRLEGSPTLDQLSAAAGANKFVLLRRFKRELGITPHAYAVARRLDHARHLLARGVHVADVAAQLGFTDQAHFTRAFGRNVGLTPARYARQVRSVAAAPAQLGR